MASKEQQNCWDFWSCDAKLQKKCPARATKSGQDCWMVVGNFAGCECSKAKMQVKSCLECPWFIKMNPTFSGKN